VSYIYNYETNKTYYVIHTTQTIQCIQYNTLKKTILQYRWNIQG